MGRSSERIEVARKALYSFQEVMQIGNPTTIERDAAIQRFEFTFEACWKAAKEVLFEREGIDAEIYSRLGMYQSIISSWLDAMEYNPI